MESLSNQVVALVSPSGTIRAYYVRWRSTCDSRLQKQLGCTGSCVAPHMHNLMRFIDEDPETITFLGFLRPQNGYS